VAGITRPVSSANASALVHERKVRRIKGLHPFLPGP
jgi:hypothetical protein